MDIYALFVLFIFCGSATAPPPSQTKQYRSDYVYNKKTDAFYKLHTETRKSWNIKDVCEVEGASPMAPETRADIVQLHTMFKRFPDLGPYVWVGEDGKDHESAEEQPLIDLTPAENEPTSGPYSSQCDVVTRDGEIETFPCYRKLPFICKVEAKDAPYDSRCGVYGRNYKYVASVGSCYKIPRIAYTWNEAFAECRAEGAHLLVVNSEAEMLAVKDITNTEPPVFGATTTYFFFAGFRAEHAVDNKPRIFRTIFNETLEQAGYNMWAPNEPNNHLTNEDCGTIFKNDGKFNDATCTQPYPFVCEKEVHP